MNRGGAVGTLAGGPEFLTIGSPRYSGGSDAG